MIQAQLYRRGPGAGVAIALACWLWAGGISTCAHPLLQNSWWVVTESNQIQMRVSATLREVVTAQRQAPGLGNRASNGLDVGRLWGAVTQHTNYLQSHLHVSADGRRLTFQVTRIWPQQESGGSDPRTPLYLDETRVRYDLEASLPPGEPVSELRFSHSMLADIPYAPGVAWQPHYLLRVKAGSREELFNGVLRAGAEVRVPLPPPRTAPSPSLFNGATNDLFAAAPAPAAKIAFSIASYFYLGVHHILGGWDHLLFLLALALGAAGFGDLFLLIAAFTVAHSLTVTLSVIKLVGLPAWVVEPVIAGSIVFVALENLFWPQRARTRARLLVAFGFGPVHGLGFAGGLKGAVVNVTGGELAAAVVAFCAGVEWGNLSVSLPLFGALLMAQRWKRDIIPRRVRPVASFLVALGGSWFLLAALRNCF